MYNCLHPTSVAIYYNLIKTKIMFISDKHSISDKKPSS